MSETLKNRFASTNGESEPWVFVTSLRKVLGKLSRDVSEVRSIRADEEFLAEDVEDLSDKTRWELKAACMECRQLI
jgi:hypothetical protein